MVKRGAHARAEGVDGGQGSADDDSLGRQEGDEVGDAESQECPRLADGGSDFGHAAARCGQELCVVLVDEAGGSQVGSNRVGRGDGFQAANVATLAGAARGRLNGDMRDVPGQATLPDEGGAIDQVGTADSGTGLDVDERIDGGHAPPGDAGRRIRRWLPRARRFR